MTLDSLCNNLTKIFFSFNTPIGVSIFASVPDRTISQLVEPWI